MRMGVREWDLRDIVNVHTYVKLIRNKYWKIRELVSCRERESLWQKLFYIYSKMA